MASETALVVALLVVLMALVWTIWNTVRHLAATNERQARLLESMATQLWSLRASETPERAAVAGQLASIAHSNGPEKISVPASAFMGGLPPAQATPWDDDVSLARG